MVLASMLDLSRINPFDGNRAARCGRISLRFDHLRQDED